MGLPSGSHHLRPSVFPSTKREGDADCPRQDCCSGLPRRVGPGSSKSISISPLLNPAARSAPRSLKAVSFSFNPPFIQGRVNADSVPGFVREASVLALGFSTLCFQALSFFNYFSVSLDLFRGCFSGIIVAILVFCSLSSILLWSE